MASAILFWLMLLMLLRHTTEQTARDKTIECKDLSRTCFKQYSLCTKSAWTRKQCPKTCKLCESVNAYVCKDSATLCTRNKFMCNKKDKRSAYVRKLCKKTCGACGAPYTKCGAKYETSEGAFVSPGYPKNYPNFALCKWVVMANSSDLINLTISVLGVEKDHDVLKVNNRKLAKGIYWFVDSMFTIEFLSDSDTAYQGFKVLWTAVNKTQRHLDLQRMINVSCSTYTFKVTVNRSIFGMYFSRTSPNSLYLTNRKCRASVSSHTIVLQSSIMGCGMRREESPTEMIYRNKLLTTSVSYGIVLASDTFDLECRVSRSASVTGNFRILSQLMVTGYGNFSLKFDFYEDSRFQNMYTKYPVEVHPRRLLFAGITLATNDRNLTIALDQCMGLPSVPMTNHIGNKNRFMLFKNKCPTTLSIKYLSSKPNQIRFQFEAFNFVQTNRELYLRCDVYVCGTNTSSSRCQVGCADRNASRRVARSMEDGGTVVELAQGPIVRGGTASLDGLTDQRGVLISGAVGGVAGLIVVVAMVLALLKIKFAMRSRRDAREDN